MLSPAKVKYRKQQKGKIRGKSYRGCDVSFGDFGMQALESGWITSRQIEAARMAISRHVKKTGKMWIRFFPHKPVTKTAAETRMGKGKGSPEEWVAVIRPGRVLYEISGVSETDAKKAFRTASHKLGIATRFLKRGGAL
ncbi:MAG: 50S ribosomal protein L16 [Deltaproteobacteria bacterium]|nr:50S ribosomal protein L16 [Deltaproteobacteria bacterium]MBN2673234.1 50S ribosomal protein L16 [Deltaproteobacteria bacterium]